MFPETFDAKAHAARRMKLAEALHGQPVLLASGKARARNYAANQYPFRAASQFLYFFGVSHPDAFGFFDGASWSLYLPDPGPDDALWEGAVPTFAEIEARATVPVRSLSQLPAALAGRQVATLPTPELEGCAHLEELLGRRIKPGVLSAVDEKLADAVIALRLRHDEAAVAEMRHAAATTDAMHRAGMRATRPGVMESDVAAAMIAEATRRNFGLAYQPIVTVHGEVLHNHHWHHRVAERDLLLADVGSESLGGWASDVTRTWPSNGKFSTSQRELYEVVLRSQLAAIEAVRPGISQREVHFVASREIARGLVELGILRGDVEELVRDGVVYLLFPHGVGHLIGLDVHDMEDLGDRAGYAPGRSRSKQFGLKYLRLDRDLEPGMAVTIEPGVYIVPAILEDATLAKLAGDRLDRKRLAQFSDVRGIRIEDDVLVTEKGCDVLTRSIPKSIAEVEAATRG